MVAQAEKIREHIILMFDLIIQEHLILLLLGLRVILRVYFVGHRTYEITNVRSPIDLWRLGHGR